MQKSEDIRSTLYGAVHKLMTRCYAFQNMFVMKEIIRERDYTGTQYETGI